MAEFRPSSAIMTVGVEALLFSSWALGCCSTAGLGCCSSWRKREGEQQSASGRPVYFPCHEELASAKQKQNLLQLAKQLAEQDNYPWHERVETYLFDHSGPTIAMQPAAAFGVAPTCAEPCETSADVRTSLILLATSGQRSKEATIATQAAACFPNGRSCATRFEVARLSSVGRRLEHLGTVGKKMIRSGCP